MYIKNDLKDLYNILFTLYGAQGWWPTLKKGYHLNDYSFPNTQNEVFEVCIGAILTQNVSWKNVEKTLKNLKELNSLTPKNLLALEEEKLKAAIKPAGYFNQKAKKLKFFTEFFLSLNGRTPGREELLSLWGIGKETADSMLLYAFKVPTFVVDTYTKRLCLNFNLIKENEEYDAIKELFEKSIKPDLKVYQEFHALIVEHAKSKKGL